MLRVRTRVTVCVVVLRVVAAAQLNDDRWHVLEVAVNGSRAELVVTLDNNSMTQSLKAYLWGNADHILQWSRLHTTITYGGRHHTH